MTKIEGATKKITEQMYYSRRKINHFITHIYRLAPKQEEI